MIKQVRPILSFLGRAIFAPSPISAFATSSSSASLTASQAGVGILGRGCGIGGLWIGRLDEFVVSARL